MLLTYREFNYLLYFNKNNNVVSLLLDRMWFIYQTHKET